MHIRQATPRAWLATVLVCFWGASWSVCSQPANYDTPLEAQPPGNFSRGSWNLSARSSSGQFIGVARPYLRSARPVLEAAKDNAFAHLDPNVMVISAERAKAILARELDLTGQWQNKIYLRLRPADTRDDVPVVSCEKFKDGWQYAVDLPEIVERWRYVKALSHVLLQEIADRRSPQRSELPRWLIEGVTAYLMLSSEHEIVLSKPEAGRGGQALASKVIQVRREHPMKLAQLALAQRPAYTFEQLSWPPASTASGNDASHYRLCSFVLLNELLRLEKGREHMKKFISTLPKYRNWQFALLEAYQGHFTRMLDVEKWWALQSAHYEGRQPGESWPALESAQQLAAVLNCTVEVHSDTNALPLTREYPLQTILREWKGREQTILLQRKLADLELVRLRLAPELAPLLNGYHSAIRYFLVEKERIHAPKPYIEEALVRKLTADTVRELDRLDQARSSQKLAAKQDSPRP